MSEKTHQISVIIINFNSSHFTINCVKSILEQTAEIIDYEIIIVENNSVKEDAEKLIVLDGLKGVKLVKSKINLGFAGGNMYGVQQASGDYYYFLNNDCILLNDCLSILYNFCQNNAQVGICSGQMFDDVMQPEANFGYFPTLATKLLGTGLLRIINPSKFPKKNPLNYTLPFPVDFVSGSSMFVRASAFHAVGGFDTTQFLYCEEEDLALQFHYLAYQTYLIPEARYQHFSGGSTKFNLLIEKEFYISFLYFYRKHYGRWQTAILQLFLFFKLIRKVFRRKSYFLLAFFVLSGAHLKNSLRHRQKIRN